MSGFMFGGSALTVDIGARNGTGDSLSHGMLVSVSFVSPGAPAPDADGFVVRYVDVGNDLTLVGPIGVVQCSPEVDVMPGETCTIRISGVTQVQLQNGTNQTVGGGLSPGGAPNGMVGNGAGVLLNTTVPAPAGSPADGGDIRAQRQSPLIAISGCDNPLFPDGALGTAWIRGLPV
jgi:hypothetical protein